MGRAAIWLALAGITFFVVTRFASLPALGRAFARMSLPWLGAALGMHLVFFLLYGLLYRTTFAMVGVRSRVWDLLPVYFAASVANVVAPTGGATGAALFIANAHRRGQSPGRAAVGVLVVLIADLLTLVPFLAWGLHELRRTSGMVGGWVLAGAAIYLALMLVLSSALWLANREAAEEAAILRWVERVVNRAWWRLRRRPMLTEGWAERTARQLADAAVAVARNPRRVGRITLLGLLLHVVNLGDLWAVFQALGQPVAPGALVCGFALGIVFFVIGVIPQGVAVVEGVMAYVFTTLGYPPGTVGAAVLVFRALNFVLPVLIGTVFVRRVAAEVAGAQGVPGA